MLSISNCVILKSIKPEEILAAYTSGATKDIKSIVKTSGGGDEIKFYTGDRNQNLYVVEEGFNKSTLYAITNSKNTKKIEAPYNCDNCKRWFIGHLIGKPLTYQEEYGTDKVDVTVETFNCHPKCTYTQLKREPPSEKNNKSIMILERICRRIGYHGKLTETPSANLAEWNGGPLSPEEFFADTETPFHTYLVYDKDGKGEVIYYNNLASQNLTVKYTVGQTVYYRQIIKK